MIIADADFLPIYFRSHSIIDLGKAASQFDEFCKALGVNPSFIMVALVILYQVSLHQQLIKHCSCLRNESKGKESCPTTYAPHGQTGYRPQRLIRGKRARCDPALELP